MDQDTLCERLQPDGGCDRKAVEARNCEHQSYQDYVERQVSEMKHPVGFGAVPYDVTQEVKFYKCLRPQS